MRDLEERFQTKFCPEPNTGCWLWTASTLKPYGYGRIGLGGREAGTELAHRVAWLLAYGELPMLHVCHKCDTPPCVNPDHLFLGTDADNLEDMRRKGRGKLPPVLRGVDHVNSIPLTSVLEIKRLRALGKSYSEIQREVGGCCKNTIANIIRGITWSHLS